MISVSSEFATGKIFKPSFNKGLELHSWSIENEKEYKKFKIKSPHFHDEFQIGYLKKGIIENNYRNEKIVIEPNQLYIIEPHEIHSEYILQEKEVAFDFIFVPTDLLKEANLELFGAESQKLYDFMITNDAINLHLIQKLKNVFSSHKNLTTQLEKEQSIVDFITGFSEIKSDAKQRDFKNVSKVLVRNLKEYMNENVFTNISLDLLSVEMSMSKFHLGRIFLSETNMTIHKYLMNLKICKAKELLNNDNSICYVAKQLGFTDKSHFIKCFKRATSETPGEFRNI